MRGYQKNKVGVSLLQGAINVCTVVAFVLQLIEIPVLEKFKPHIALIVCSLILVSIIINIVCAINFSVSRKRLIKKTEKLLHNSTGKIVLLGGDLSWTDDYLDEIRLLTNNSQVVEIIFPYEKIQGVKKSVLDRFSKRIIRLKQAGADIYCSMYNYHFRYTLVDVNADRNNEALKVISCKRIYKHKYNNDKNKYEAFLLDNKNDKDKVLCDLFYQNYMLIKQKCYKY